MISWSAQIQTEMKLDEPARDPASVDVQMKLHEELKAEIDAREDMFAAVIEMGRRIIETGHFSSQDVSSSCCE